MTEMPEFEIARLQLRPGESLVVKVPEHLPDGVREQIERFVKGKLGIDAPILVLDGGTELGTMSPAPSEPFQDRVRPWMLACFGEAISADIVERNHRFLEEAIELVQSKGCTRDEAHQLVDYVFDRPPGEPSQEVGGVKVTLAALCLAADIDMDAAGETELARIWTKVEQIRAKQAAKPKHSPLPERVSSSALPNPPGDSQAAQGEAIGAAPATGQPPVGAARVTLGRPALGRDGQGEPVFRIIKRGSYVMPEPLRATFDLPNGEYDLWAAPAGANAVKTGASGGGGCLSRQDICRLWQDVAVKRPNLTVMGFVNELLWEIDDRPTRHVRIEHDGFAGDIIGHYLTREGKRGVVIQQDGTRVVHVYGEKWLAAPDSEGQ